MSDVQAGAMRLRSPIRWAGGKGTMLSKLLSLVPYGEGVEVKEAALAKVPRVESVWLSPRLQEALAGPLFSLGMGVNGYGAAAQAEDDDEGGAKRDGASEECGGEDTTGGDAVV